MKYGGHGAHVAMNHPIVLALYLAPSPAFVGLYLLRNWGRYLSPRVPLDRVVGFVLLWRISIRPT